MDGVEVDGEAHAVLAAVHGPLGPHIAGVVLVLVPEPARPAPAELEFAQGGGDQVTHHVLEDVLRTGSRAWCDRLRPGTGAGRRRGAGAAAAWFVRTPWPGGIGIPCCPDLPRRGQWRQPGPPRGRICLKPDPGQLPEGVTFGGRCPRDDRDRRPMVEEPQPLLLRGQQVIQAGYQRRTEVAARAWKPQSVLAAAPPELQLHVSGRAGPV